MTTIDGVHFEGDPREILRTCMNWVLNQQPAGLPFSFQQAIDDISESVENLTRGTTDADDQAWQRAAIATRRILRERSEAVNAEWTAAFAGLPAMSWPGGSEEIPDV